MSKQIWIPALSFNKEKENGCIHFSLLLILAVGSSVKLDKKDKTQIEHPVASPTGCLIIPTSSVEICSVVL